MQETTNNIGLDYNTEREKLQMPEYGRNVLKMVEKMKEIPDREKRSAQARCLTPRYGSWTISTTSCGTTSIS